jgi:hypothetical protein
MSFESPRDTKKAPSSPPPLREIRFDAQTRVTYEGFLVCSSRAGVSQARVRSRCSSILGVEANKVMLIEKEDGEVCAYVDASLPVFSDEPVTCRLMSGRSLEIPAKIPVALVYVLISEVLNCNLQQIRLVYKCSDGCGVHRHSLEIEREKNANLPLPYVDYTFLNYGDSNIERGDHTNTPLCQMCPTLEVDEVEVITVPDPISIHPLRFL